jgi:lipopolysaccharide biosynthesis protein
VAFHLPQFHPIPENDEWWGPGFTEWTNVAKARPLFHGHAQPHLPADLGFYDLRVAETRDSQAELAGAAGVSAFCYWHYWFAGRRILQRPVDEIIGSGDPDFPFCLGWANQTWTGIWHGAPHRVLLEQTYPGAADDQAHFDHLLPAFTDPRYLTVDGRPVFYVFRPEQLPDPAEWTARWQAMAKAAGLPGMYLIAEVSDLLGYGPSYVDVRSDGWDVGVYVRLPVRQDRVSLLKMRLRRKVRGGPEVFPYDVKRADVPKAVRSQVLPCVYPNWDNTPRSARGGVVLTGSSPTAFGQQLRGAIGELGERTGEERLLFLKSWNEWAEGNYIEPDQEFGSGWLQALQGALSEYS